MSSIPEKVSLSCLYYFVQWHKTETTGLVSGKLNNDGPASLRYGEWKSFPTKKVQS